MFTGQKSNNQGVANKQTMAQQQVHTPSLPRGLFGLRSRHPLESVVEYFVDVFEVLGASDSDVVCCIVL